MLIKRESRIYSYIDEYGEERLYSFNEYIPEEEYLEERVYGAINNIAKAQNMQKVLSDRIANGGGRGNSETLQALRQKMRAKKLANKPKPWGYPMGNPINRL